MVFDVVVVVDPGLVVVVVGGGNGTAEVVAGPTWVGDSGCATR